MESIAVSTAAATAPAAGIAVISVLNLVTGGGGLAVVVKLTIDLVKKWLPKRWLPVIAPVLATVLYALWQELSGTMNFQAALSVGLFGGLGAIGLHEVVNTAIRGRVRKKENQDT
ncbi:MAG: hypothetical protein ABIG11_02880 [bacterium]